MAGKVPPGWASKPSVILDERGWIYTGSRFVSPVGCEAGEVMLFVSAGVAESVAGHLRLRGQAPGIVSKKADWLVIRGAKYPAIIGNAPMTLPERVAAKRIENQGKRLMNQRKGRPRKMALLASEQREVDATRSR